MGFQPMTFQPETFAQANPVLTGIQAAQQTRANAYNNQIAAARAQYAQQMGAQGLQQAILNNQVLGAKAQTALPQANATTQILQNTANYAPQMSQSTLATQAASRGLMGSQSGYYGANAGLIGQEAQKAAFFNQHPTSMLPGVAGNIANYALLRQLMPGEFGQNQVAPPTQNQVVANDLSNGTPTTLPGMPSAGMFASSPSQSGAPILPTAGSIGSQQPPMQQQPFNSGIPYAQNASMQQQISPQGQSGGMGGLPSVQQFANLMMQQQTAPIEKNLAQTQFYSNKAALANFSALPVNDKANLIAQGRALGLNPSQTVDYISRGGNLNQLSSSMGGGNRSIYPQYAPSPSAISKDQISTAATSALTDINPVISNALAPYSRHFLGMSPKLIMQELSGSDPDSQAQALAARALSPEVAGLRLKAMSAQSGIEAIHEVQDASMLSLKNSQSLVSPQVYRLSNQYLDNWVARMTNSYNGALYGHPGQITVPSAPNSSSSPQNNAPPQAQMVTVIAPNGSRVNIPSSNLAAALKRGARQA